MMYDAQDNCRSNTPMDLVQELEAETNTASEEHQRLDEIYKVLHRASIEYYMRRKREWEENGYQKRKRITRNRRNGGSLRRISKDKEGHIIKTIEGILSKAQGYSSMKQDDDEC